MTDLATAAARDASDRLARYRDLFAIPDAGLLYMDGNSLGRPPVRSLERLTEAAHEEWADGLVRSWAHWVELPAAGGDLLAPLLGAQPGEAALTDQTSINLYKLATAAVSHRAGPIVTDSANFPSDLYVLRAVAERAGVELRIVDSTPEMGTPPDRLAAAAEGAALVSLSHVAYKSGALADMAEITAASHRAGAMVLWDLSHSVGAVPIDLAGCEADLAVGCTYKYLNGGPGAPAFLYVRSDLQPVLDQPIQGWFGHSDMFAFAGEFRAAPDIRRFTVGTPPILSLAAAMEGIRVSAEAGIGAIREKSIALTELIVDLFDAWLAPLGFALGSPRDPRRRGGHVAVRHPDGRDICRRLAEEHQVITDFRGPDSIRIAPAALYTRFVDVWHAMDRLRKLAA